MTDRSWEIAAVAGAGIALVLLLTWRHGQQTGAAGPLPVASNGTAISQSVPFASVAPGGSSGPSIFGGDTFNIIPPQFSVPVFGPGVAPIAVNLTTGAPQCGCSGGQIATIAAQQNALSAAYAQTVTALEGAYNYLPSQPNIYIQQFASDPGIRPHLPGQDY